MKLVTYNFNGETKVGAVQDDSVIDLSMVAPDMLHLIASGPEGLARAQAQVTAASSATPLASVRLLAPIPTPPRNVMCLGLNYASHAEESQRAKGWNLETPPAPIIFTKAPSSVNGPYDDIPFDANVSEMIDWEAEMAVVIGRSGKNISREDAMAYVFGYTVINDVSARDLQRQHNQFFKGKSLDGYCPMGPWIVTAGEIPDPYTLNVACRVNGVTKQESDTSYMIFDIADIIYHLSRGMTLVTGDVIATGTPGGVGFARQPPEYLKPGDIVECEVENIGKIRNRITAVT